MNPRKPKPVSGMVVWILFGLLATAGATYGGQQGSVSGSSAGIVAINGVTGEDFGEGFSWYVTAVKQRISSNWLQSKIDANLQWAQRVIVSFDILRNGTVTNIQITQSSNNYSVDASAMRAVRQASPMMPLPAAYGGSRVGVEFYFDYQKQTAQQQPQGTSSNSMALPDCQGRPAVEPERVTLTCADGNFSIENISWTGWGASFAAGMGTGKINDCEPSCAAGHFHTYPMLLIVTGAQTCPNNQPAYEKVVYTFVGRSGFPADAPGTLDPTREFACGVTSASAQQVCGRLQYFEVDSNRTYNPGQQIRYMEARGAYSGFLNAGSLYFVCPNNVSVKTHKSTGTGSFDETGTVTIHFRPATDPKWSDATVDFVCEDRKLSVGTMERASYPVLGKIEIGGTNSICTLSPPKPNQ